ncbi:hypothetical protein PCANC_08343 [Puccinia coronata f. sp. avenae]|uniref:TrmE-type G domain-containing protein n=1 Tax=Puccinia coronata f. sp. avenae TaxID=200324 RepID=A0A2N5T4K3_9BASI|nr:hypothetical protein PCANC_08343 [Puccinia coronata f. sp. avenae]PLW51247.1 hypothetical protein PCASD_00949 [Puccinia coronata f. sp. avenae]
MALLRLRLHPLVARRRSLWTASHADTIYGPATPAGAKAALAIVRVDGPQALQLCHAITRPIQPPSPSPITPGRVALRRVVCPFSQRVIDPETLLLRFDHPSPTHPASTIEFHLHGSPAVVKALLGTLSKLSYLRLAQPGEFTRRRFERAHGSMDINKVLGLKHLIDAETEEQRRWAVHEFDSKFNQTYQEMRRKLKTSMALCEAIIDFSEDGSMDDREMWDQVIASVRDLKSTIEAHLSSSQRREKIATGIRVALYGSPNVGKSTLLNHLVNREAAIVSPYSGTTRDIIEVSIDYHGFPIILSDTAGLRSSTDPVEAIGIGRAKDNIGKADVRLLLVSATDGDDAGHPDPLQEHLAAQETRPTMVLVSKTDLLIDHPPGHIDRLLQTLKLRFPGVPVLPISVLNPAERHGMRRFLESFESHLRSMYGSEELSSRPNSFYLTTYQKIQLEKILGHINTFMGRLNAHLSSGAREEQNEALEEDLDLVILIEELRMASGLLSKLCFSSPSSPLDHHNPHSHEISTDEILGEMYVFFI